jgi:hypothetical protein
VRVEQLAALTRDRQPTLVVAEVNMGDQAFVPQVREGVVIGVQVVLGHHSERADGRQRAAVLAVQFVHPAAVDHQLALLAPWQVEVARQPVARVQVVAVADVIHAGTVLTGALTITRVISPIEHGCPPAFARLRRATARQADNGLRLGCS